MIYYNLNYESWNKYVTCSTLALWLKQNAKTTFKNAIFNIVLLPAMKIFLFQTLLNAVNI